MEDITPANAYAQADQARLLRMDGKPVRYGQRIHPDHPLVIDHASINALARSLRLLHHQAADSAAHALNAMIDDFEAMGLIHRLREAEGDSVEIVCDNQDFNGLPNRCIIGIGGWTGYEPQEFRADTLLQCLAEAVRVRDEFYDAQRAEFDAHRAEVKDKEWTPQYHAKPDISQLPFGPFSIGKAVDPDVE